ncbi:unnamed protein product [Linum tenue]|uniref:CRM domain-containing protein n=1 Tax=Linum tenue TaxID=586396 RepID=A0AAV0ND30_9ROSI|nr:unnamed protein product [Linum tenue]
MLASRILRSHCFRTLSALHLSSNNPSRTIVLALNDVGSSSISSSTDSLRPPPLNCSAFGSGWCRGMSTSKGRSMRSKVESRMRKESGKTMREIRRAKKLKKKLMTDEERLIYNLKRAKKKVALLLQKLKKYELPELPPSVHDPELFTPEQLQSYKKIGFKNKNYVPVGVRGVFGGVVQNMHMHWKFHETVQVCCDNFPKEKIKEMATMIARLSGGIVVNIHNVKTIIMFRGRNYRQPKNLIPFNTLTKRKALFKARFEQALESQKLNIKKIEQQLRRMGVNPEDPVAMASIQRVASTFFNAIDSKEGSPYVFKGDELSSPQPADDDAEHSDQGADSDQEELNRFISEIEDAADREWAAEEAAEQEEFGRIRYRNKDENGGRLRFENKEAYEEAVRQGKMWRDPRDDQRSAGRDDDDDERVGILDEEDEWDSDDDPRDTNDHVIGRSQKMNQDRGRSMRYSNNDRVDRRPSTTKFNRKEVEEKEEDEWDSDDDSRDTNGRVIARSQTRNQHRDTSTRYNNSYHFDRRPAANKFNRKEVEEKEEDSESDDMLSDLDNAMWNSDEEEDEIGASKKKVPPGRSFRSSSSGEEDDEEDSRGKLRTARGARVSQGRFSTRTSESRASCRREPAADGDSGSDDVGFPMWQSDSDDELNPNEGSKLGFNHTDETKEHGKQGGKKVKTVKEMDELWDSD